MSAFGGKADMGPGAFRDNSCRTASTEALESDNCRKFLGSYFWMRLTTLFVGHPCQFFILFGNVEENDLSVTAFHFLGLLTSISRAEAPIARVFHPRRHFFNGHCRPPKGLSSIFDRASEALRCRWRLSISVTS